MALQGINCLAPYGTIIVTFVGADGNIGNMQITTNEIKYILTIETMYIHSIYSIHVPISLFTFDKRELINRRMQ